MSETTASRTGGGYLSLLRNREYVGLLISCLVSMIGDQLSRVALVVLVYQRTNSPLLSSATYAATFLPVVVGAPLLGGFADRLPRRQVMIAADLIRAAFLALMAVPGLPIWVLIALLFCAVTVESPWAAARGALMRQVLENDENYQRGTSLDEALFQGGQIVGFLAAGALLLLVTPSTALLLDAASFVAAAVVVRVLVQHHSAADDADGPAVGDAQGSGRLASGVRRGFTDARIGFCAAMSPACRRPLLLTWAGISFSIAPEALAVPWADQLGVEAVGVGLILAASPAGAVVGMLIFGRLSVERGQRLLVPLALLALLPLLLAPATLFLTGALVVAFLAGVGGTYAMFARVAFMRAVPDAERGRAYSVAGAGVMAGQGLGIALAGAIASLTSPAMSIALTATLGLLLVGLVIVTTPAPDQHVRDGAEEADRESVQEPAAVDAGARTGVENGLAVPTAAAADDPTDPRLDALV